MIVLPKLCPAVVHPSNGYFFWEATSYTPYGGRATESYLKEHPEKVETVHVVMSSRKKKGVSLLTMGSRMSGKRIQ
jgi:hypothetical protein